MKFTRMVAVLVLALALLVPTITYAVDYVTDATNALQDSPVYVAPGTEGTDSDTAGKLARRLKESDNIVLVMLPATAEEGTDISSVAIDLSEKLGNQRIIGLSIGKKVIGYAPMLPVGVAADQMRRADSVSNDPVTALGTFAQNIHLWLAASPQPTPSPRPTPLPTPLPPRSPQAKKNAAATLYGSAAVVVVVFVSLTVLDFKKRQAEVGRTRFKAPDQQVRDLLASIAKIRLLVDDQELSGVVYQMCEDIERYFRSSSNDKRKDARFFKERLADVLKVLERYVEIQNNRRYYSEPEEQLTRGKEAIRDFEVYVLEAIRRGNAAALLEYSVNTNILQAQRYRNLAGGGSK